jgi:hypothetical protein
MWKRVHPGGAKSPTPLRLPITCRQEFHGFSPRGVFGFKFPLPTNAVGTFGKVATQCPAGCSV